MLEKLRLLFPQKLKYRLFTAFLVLILLPFSILNLYNYQRVEAVMQQKLSEKSYDQLQQIIGALDDLMNMAFKTWIMLEQDAAVREVLLHPENGTILDNKHAMEAKFIGINNSLFLLNPVVYYTLLDLQGNTYTSYQPRRALDYEQLIKGRYFQEALTNNQNTAWVTDEENYVASDLSASQRLLSMYTVFKDPNRSYRPYGVARISIDYSYWFKSVLHGQSPDQEYFLLTADGEHVAQSRAEGLLTDEAVRQIAQTQGNGYFIDRASAMVVNYSYIATLDWYMVNRTPLGVLFNEIDALKRQFFATSIAFMVLFIVMTFMIASTITRPLSHLQNKMKDVVRKSLRLRLPQDKYRGEILDLTRTFNSMLDDMNGLIQRLKEEERQKEAVHFQMLLAQINPHFLLNTLNTMKWIAIRQRNEDIEEICVSLGKLLEMSLNSELDMIHLKDELELVQAYVHIQQKRFNYKLDVAYRYEPDTAYALVPKLSIQPLVENAIQHGIAHIEGEGRIDIVIEREQQRLMIRVRDNGAGLAASRDRPSARRSSGIGIRNLQERLALLFKGQGGFELRALEQGTEALITIPLLVSVPYGGPEAAGPTVPRHQLS
ncbi:cache domain-containing sensor histidine kinase [Paenibacillus sp. 1P07SE]|uniref:cache domain-containing sensor histidine kinase n=1 Tax=Paenibacillus sp. 1P07SE TaxID=3132209 RepID=UPI0039A6C470